MMKRLSVFFFALLTALSLALCLTALSALADDNDGKTRKGRYCNVTEAKKLRDDTRVIVRGYIVQRIADDHYLLRDSTGSIRIELDDDYRNGSERFRSGETANLHGAVAKDDDDDDDDNDNRRRKKRSLVDPRARVEVVGKIDRDDGSVEIDVDILRRL